MRMSASILLLSLPFVALAQGYQNMNQAEMQKMMQQMEKMQSCMNKIDQGQLRRIQQRSQQLQAEIKSLCQAGKRSKAHKKAVSYGKEMSSDPTMKAMAKCGEMIKGMEPPMPLVHQEKDYSRQHVCDQYAR